MRAKLGIAFKHELFVLAVSGEPTVLKRGDDLHGLVSFRRADMRVDGPRSSVEDAPAFIEGQKTFGKKRL